jgi:hypothetical protein
MRWNVRRLALVLWFGVSALLLLLAIVLAYISMMMGAVHWDWWLSLGLGAGFLALGGGCFWMCRRAYRLLKAN